MRLATGKPLNLWEVFARLFAAYGPQGWWPVSTRAGASPRYRPGVYAPLSAREVHEIAFGAVLAQNTAWENARRALVALGAAGVRSPGDVCACPVRELEGLIRSSGYFRQKARRLKALAGYLADADAARAPTPALREELLSLGGVGPETADSILLYALARPAFVVDAYTRRLLARLEALEREPSYGDAQRLFVDALAPSVPLYSEYHALIVAVAKRHCRARALCERCPLLRLCRTGGRRRPPRRGRRADGSA